MKTSAVRITTTKINSIKERDMLENQTMEILRSLRLPGMADALEQQRSQPATRLEAALGIETFRTDGALFKGRIPPLGSYYAFELHEIAADDYAVRLRFVTDDDDQVVKIPGCDGEMCALDRFLALAREIAPKDWRKSCKI